MLSGRLAGMAVSPFPLQSTMLLLHVHMAGQEPPPTLHACRPGDSWWPGKKKEKWAKYQKGNVKLIQVCECGVTLSWIMGCD